MSENKYNRAKTNRSLNNLGVNAASGRRKSRFVVGFAMMILTSSITRAQMTLTASPNPSTAGNSITVSVTNPCGPHAASELFSYYYGTSPSVTPSNLIKNGSGLTSISWTPPAPGTYYLYVSLSPYPSPFCTTGNSNIAKQVVNGVASSVVLASSPNPSTYGSSVTFTATVTPSTATGTVNFQDGGSSLDLAAISNGQASYSASTLAPGVHSMTASYGGDSLRNPSTSSPLTQIVNKVNTTIAVSSSLNPSTYGSTVTFTATVTPSAASGTVQFRSGGVNLGSAVTVSGGKATYGTSTLAVGSSSITANYSGDSDYSGSTSSPLTQTVNVISTTVALASSLNPSIYGTSLTFSATVTPSSATGTISFLDGSNTLGAVALSGGTATYSTSSLTAGTHTLTAVYSGSLDYTGSTSSNLTQTVLTAIYNYTIPVGYYASNGNLLGYMDSVMGSWAFGYDTLNRLTGAATNQTGNTSYCWGYDAWGNRSIQAGSSAAFAVGSPTCQPASGASYTSTWTNILSNNRVGGTNQAPAGLGYDAAGDVTNDGVNNYMYDAEGRICAVQNQSMPGMPMTGYIYNAEGERVAKGSITTMSCDPTLSGFKPSADYVLGLGGNHLTEMDSDGNGNMVWAHTNVYAAGNLIATYDSKGLHFHFSDWLGTRRAQTNYAGALELSCTSLPYGDNLLCAGPGQDATEHHFTGKERDAESGLDNFGARYNASTMGRFMTPDPLLNSGHPGSPQTWNRYSYALNNPLSIKDPTGLYNVNCGDDKSCQKSAERLKKGLEKLQNKVDKMKDSDQKTRLEHALGAMGTENDKNNVNVSFGAIAGTAAATTDAHFDSATNSYSSFDVKFDMPKTGNSDANGMAINGAHEGTHVGDYQDPLGRSQNPATAMDGFQYEFRGYQTSAWAAQALGVSPLSFGGNVIWNSSWAAADRQTLMGRGITGIVTGAPYNQPENPIHDPWPDRFPEPNPGPF